MNDTRLAPGIDAPDDALRFSYSSSPGPGGQNVNKRATKAELRVRLIDLPLPPDALTRLKHLAGSRVSAEGELILTPSEHRSQSRNRAECLDRLRELVARALVRPRQRRATKPTKSSVRARLAQKKHRSSSKRTRGTPREDE